MTKLEILKCIANSHNRLTEIMVKGDDAIMMGETLKEMRTLAQMIQNDIEAEPEPGKEPEEACPYESS